MVLETKRVGLGDLLIRAGAVSRADVDSALAEQARTHERIGEILVRRRLLAPSELLDVLAAQFGIARYDPALHAVEQPALELIPQTFARRHHLLPIRVENETLVVAIADPLDLEAVDALKRLADRAGKRIELLLAAADRIAEERDPAYGRLAGQHNVLALLDRAADEAKTALVSDDVAEAEAQRRAQDASVVRLVDQIIDQAAHAHATDIHIEPQSGGLLIRYRVDGLLYEALRPPAAVLFGVVSRVKILAHMDIAERRAPQDGRFTYRRNGYEFDVRVSAIPTIHGEKIALRLLNRTGFKFTLPDLGFSEADQEIFLAAIHRPYGMILLSGPTGSGKTTTLYASLLAVCNPTVNIVTVEDPVEYRIDTINQVQVNPRKNVTFASALRSFLRQDPDIIMVGEIRDRETADIAVRAALTGHLVFSTIHANDAPATATRLLSMGAEAFMTASALSLVAAQRLVRRNCIHCLTDYAPPEPIRRALGWGRDPADSAASFKRGVGCAACEGRGFSGRVAIVERMPVTPAVRELIAANRPATEIRKQSLADGMQTLRQSGLEKAAAGITTPEEVLRVCLSDD